MFWKILQRSNFRLLWVTQIIFKRMENKTAVLVALPFSNTHSLHTVTGEEDKKILRKLGEKTLEKNL